MRSNLRSLAASSLLLLVVITAAAEVRPRYGGTLRVEMRSAMQAIDPQADNASAATAQVASLLFDTLTQLDDSGRAVPLLAASWQQETERRWRFELRNEAHFNDGTAVTPAAVAQSLQEANPEWIIRTLADSVVIESEKALPNLPAQLALPRNSVVVRAGDTITGSGPFRVETWQPGHRLVLRAQDHGWHSRPFVDAIEIVFARDGREQLMDLELNRADLVEVPPDQVSRLQQAGRRLGMSEPVELLALRFGHTNAAAKDARVREMVSLAIDRDSITGILLQRRGKAAGGLLPNWLTGFSFLFPTASDMARARQLRAQLRPAPSLVMVYDASDPLARLIAERVALNVGDTGATLKTLPSTQNTTVPDLELVRVRLASSDPAVALSEVTRAQGLAAPETVPKSPAELYAASSAALKDYWTIPIAYVPAAYAAGARVRNWTQPRDGSWELENLWLEPPTTDPTRNPGRESTRP